MKSRNIVRAMTVLLALGQVAGAAETLETSEILGIFQYLTSQARNTWIPQGVIHATHQQYTAAKTLDPNQVNQAIREKITQYGQAQERRELTVELQKMALDAIPFNVRYELANESTMTSAVTVKYDGERFYWEINTLSRTDSIRPGPDMAGNYMVDNFDLGWNSRRIFTWDGAEYTTYFLPGNHAVVDSTGTGDRAVNGPLKAGIIPWGHGYYTYENLAALDSSAQETYDQGAPFIHLTLINPNGLEIFMVLDAERDYSVTACTMSGAGTDLTSIECTGYRLVSGNWVPQTVVVEGQDDATGRLLTRDTWVFNSVTCDAPGPEQFRAAYEEDAIVEYYSDQAAGSMLYRHTDAVDTEHLLSERLAATDPAQVQNCATVAMKYAVSKLGRSVTDQQLAGLVGGPDNAASLYAMRQLAWELGLYSRAVTTDIQTLSTLDGCQAILHIPGKSHFVVLEQIDDEFVRIVDLSSNRFFYRTQRAVFDMDWTGGTALLLSNTPIDSHAGMTDIADDQLPAITGAGGYSCTRLLQNYAIKYCSQGPEGNCTDEYMIFYERWGCEPAETGSCSSPVMLRMRRCLCVRNIDYPIECIGNGQWQSAYMLACM